MRIPLFVFGLRPIVVGLVLHDATWHGSGEESIPLFAATVGCSLLPLNT